MLLALILAMSDPEIPDAYFYLETPQDVVCVVSDPEKSGFITFTYRENVLDCPEGTVAVVKKENVS